MKKLFLLLVILIFACPAFAASWIQISSTEYIKIDKREGNNVYYWVKSLNDGYFPKEQNQDPGYYTFNYISDCKKNSSKNLAFYIYSKTGKVLYSEDKHTARSKIPIHKSKGEFWHKSACCPVSIK